VLNFLTNLRNAFRRSAPPAPVRSRQLACESLEDRATPSISPFAANFHGFGFPASDYNLFTNVTNVSGPGFNPESIKVTEQTFAFKFGGVSFDFTIPEFTFSFNPATPPGGHGTGTGAGSTGAGKGSTGTGAGSGQGEQTGTAIISGNVSYTMLGDGAGPAVGDTVTLTNSAGTVVANTTTDSNGNYSFGSLAAGTYTVTVSDSYLNGGSEGMSVVVTSGQNSSSNNFVINQ
jgi:hypothetical protein